MTTIPDPDEGRIWKKINPDELFIDDFISPTEIENDFSETIEIYAKERLDIAKQKVKKEVEKRVKEVKNNINKWFQGSHQKIRIIRCLALYFTKTKRLKRIPTLNGLEKFMRHYKDFSFEEINEKFFQFYNINEHIFSTETDKFEGLFDDFQKEAEKELLTPENKKLDTSSNLGIEWKK